MGVTGLWTVVQPCARPIKLETLNKKRLAVDASIWIYQFLKAVRDKEGHALRNSHIVGFFRRICKLLFVGIKPVFVFDGGAPALKRATISARKARREGRREDAVRTAGKLLALQMQRRAEEEEERRRREEGARRGRGRGRDDGVGEEEEEEEALPETLVYADEVLMTPAERTATRKFKKTDAYHLPNLDVSLAEMGQPNDPRIMSMEELEAYARQFDTGEDINVYDFAKIDFESAFFTSLPAGDRYNILNAARLRSRLRMGHSKEQLDAMFPDRMAFSRFQIERVRERNELTQRLMHINGAGDDAGFGGSGGGRVAGEKGREYILLKNDGVEGGWALGVVSGKKEGDRSRPIDVERPRRARRAEEVEEEEEDDEEAFEDVPIEGLNRLPKRAAGGGAAALGLADRRNAIYTGREQGAGKPEAAGQSREPEELFVRDEGDGDVENEWEDVDVLQINELFEEPQLAHAEEDDEDLNCAIAMSLEKDHGSEEDLNRAIAMSLEKDHGSEEDDDDYLEVFEQSRAEEAKPFTRASGQAIAHVANNRSSKAAPLPFAASDSEEEGPDLQAALAESRKTKRPTGRSVHRPDSDVKLRSKATTATAAPIENKASGFDGPLPFEKLDLGSSLLGRKKMEKLQEDSAGGFEKDARTRKDKANTQLPPWFSGDPKNDIEVEKGIQQEYRESDKQFSNEGFEFEQQATLRRQQTGEVIDLVAEQGANEDAISVVSSDREIKSTTQIEPVVVDSELRMGDLADLIRAEPPQPSLSMRQAGMDGPSAAESREGLSAQEVGTPVQTDVELTAGPNQSANGSPTGRDVALNDSDYEWEGSDQEAADNARTPNHDSAQPAGGNTRQEPSRSPSLEFENVGIDVSSQQEVPSMANEHTNGDEEEIVPMSGTADEGYYEGDGGEENLLSDPEDDELFRQLAIEAEEHARFASTFNNKSQQENVMDYERELKQLRNQQKKDRRDADEVTHIMVTECQQLLKLFGLPYITAPMEAEAQCAELVSLGLVDGVVTDDSDIFLFGGTRVYKNVFNQAKFVECYLASDLEKEFALTRHALIRIAHLLGSDYTEGLRGVGPVTALEIISDFPTLDSFKRWWSGVQMNSITKADDAPHPFRKKFRKNATKLFLPAAFPDPRVDVAYMQPDVDADPSPFQWGVPDLDALRSFLMAQIGWTQQRTDEVLVPVIRDMNRRENEGTQANITKFVSGGAGAGAFAPRRRGEGKSRRMEVALLRMASQAKGRREDGDAGGAEESGLAGVDRGDGDGDERVVGDGAVVAVTGTAVERKSGKTRTKGAAGKGAKRAVSPSVSPESEEYDARPKKTRRRNKGSKQAQRVSA